MKIKCSYCGKDAEDGGALTGTIATVGVIVGGASIPALNIPGVLTGLGIVAAAGVLEGGLKAVGLGVKCNSCKYKHK